MNVEALNAWFRVKLGDDIEIVWRERGGGQSNLMQALTISWSEQQRSHQRDLIVRLQPTEAAGHQIFDDADAVREGQVMRGLHETDVPVPNVRWIEPDATVVGAPFFVMDQVQGTAPLAKPSIHESGWLTTASPVARHRVSHAGIEAMTRLHAVDWQRTHPFLSPDRVASAPIDVVEHLARYYRWVTRGRTFRVTDQALAHLAARAPSVAPAPPVLVWGDARPGNVLYADNGEVVALIDWELASIGPAAIDVGHWVFMDRFHAEAQGIDRLPGYPAESRVIAHYEAESGSAIEDLDFYLIRSALLMATTVIRQTDLRIARHELSPSTTMAQANLCTQFLAHELGVEVPELSPDWTAHRAPRPTPTVPTAGGTP